MIGASPDHPRSPDGTSALPGEDHPDKPEGEDYGLNKEIAGSDRSSPAVKPPKGAKRALITIPPGSRSRFHPKELWAHYGGVLLIIVALILIIAGISTLVSSDLFSHGESSDTPIPVITPVTTEGWVTPTPTVTVTAGPAGDTGTISFVPGPVELPPENLRISLQVERDPRSHLVSVMYMGGKGQYGVRDILVKLTRSDGTVLEETFRPVQVGSHVELQGTQKEDRVEVTVRYYTGAEYKVVDQVFEYRIRT